MSVEDMKTLLSEIYTDTSNPASFSSLERLYKESKKHNSKITRKFVQKWARGHTTYTLHRKVRWNFPRRKTIVAGIDDQWQMDLVSLIKLAPYNSQKKHMLTVIDVFSRFAFAKPLKTKTGTEVTAALEEIFTESGRFPQKIQADQGTEFFNRVMLPFLKDRNIKIFSVYSDPKAALVERFNRSIKKRMFSMFSEKNTLRWVDNLQDLVDAYNRSVHRIIGMAPKDVNAQNEETLWKKLYSKEFPNKAKFRFNIGDTVRIARIPTTIFEKGYEAKWTREHFTVTHRRATQPVTYKLMDLKNELIKGSFYDHQIQLIEKPSETDQYQVDILKERNRKGKLQYFVHYRGWPSTFDEWVNKTQLYPVYS